MAIPHDSMLPETSDTSKEAAAAAAAVLVMLSGGNHGERSTDC